MAQASEKPPVKKLRCIQRSVDRHWVGNGFPVRTLFAYPNLGPVLSPFLLLDYAGPREFPPTTRAPRRRRASASRLRDRDHRLRGRGRAPRLVRRRRPIGPGDVQWMTAASGIVHEEFHGREFARRGGLFEMVQLWVNLPAKDKMAPPRYQSIMSRRHSRRQSARTAREPCA